MAERTWAWAALGCGALAALALWRARRLAHLKEIVRRSGGAAIGGAAAAPVVVLLGSSSKWRAKLVSGALPAGFALHPRRLSPDIDEKAIRRADAGEMTVAIAGAKADELLRVLRDPARCAAALQGEPVPDLLICCDQVVVHAGEVREKAESVAQCKARLQSYGRSGKPAECTSGVVVVDVRSGERRAGVDVALQWIGDVPDAVADALIAKGEVCNCAGSFVAEDPLLAPYLGKREGELESVQGMPVGLTRRLLQEVAAAAAIGKHTREATSTSPGRHAIDFL
jgi:predicted house-cleaning NTP pyrophosphatase (Maf/HAM1 superfamily)